MTTQIDPDFIGSYTTPDRVEFSVSATRGTQAIGWITGDPMNDTERGPLTLTINTERRGVGGVEGAYVSVDLSAADHQALRDLLDAGARVANDRDRSRDERPPADA